MRISDWSSDVCSSDLISISNNVSHLSVMRAESDRQRLRANHFGHPRFMCGQPPGTSSVSTMFSSDRKLCSRSTRDISARSEEHTSELQSLMRISYAVFCLNKKT